MQLRCDVNMIRYRIHIYTDDASVDDFYKFAEDEDYREVIASLGYDISELDLNVITSEVSKSKYKVSSVEDIVGRQFAPTDRLAGAHKYIETYEQHIEELDSRIKVVFDPAIHEDYSISKDNYPNGISIRIDTPIEFADKISDILEGMKEDLDILITNVAVFDCDINIL